MSHTGFGPLAETSEQGTDLPNRKLLDQPIDVSVRPQRAGMRND